MKNRWQEQTAQAYAGDLLALRIYTSQLLGQEEDLVLHGGGNTSVKVSRTNLFGEQEELLYIKGSGWDLATISAQGFSPVKLKPLRQAAELTTLSDLEMMRLQKAALWDPAAPSPSIEAILHALIPYRFVDHTHADAVATLTNTPEGEKIIQRLYSGRVLLVPYVMPGFSLAKKVYQMTRQVDWTKLEGLILMHHGIVTFADDAATSYSRMIQLVSEAEAYLQKHVPALPATAASAPEDLLSFARIRRAVSQAHGRPVLARWENDPFSLYLSSQKQTCAATQRGPLTPDHVIRTKRTPVILGPEPVMDINRFVEDYYAYFHRHAQESLTCLSPGPAWALWPGQGRIAFAPSLAEAKMIADLAYHTLRSIYQAEALSGWTPVNEKEAFQVEYWELEQVKLRSVGIPLPLQGKIALVTGAASGIGQACVKTLLAQGAAVSALDIAPEIQGMYSQPAVYEIICDLLDPAAVKAAVQSTLRQFGGLDILISNAGLFPPSETIENLSRQHWEKSLAINLTSHQTILQICVPFLALGWEPAVVIIASKNVPAPGPGAAAYSVAKAGLTQLARVAALELAPHGIRVNVLHPHAVFDTKLWTPEILEKRAQQYGLSVEAYKKNNLLKTEITSKDVANLACAMAGPLFAKTTGAQVPIDGGNDRVI